MSSLNKCCFIGRLGKSPETRYTSQNKPVTSFSIACTESWKDQSGQKQEKTEWVNLVAFGNLADICGKYLDKGSQVYVEGKFTTDQYEKNGETRYSTKVVVNELVMLGGKPDSTHAAQQEPYQPNDFDDSEVPF